MSTRVYVGGLSHRARERDVEKHFGHFGRIRDVSIKNGYAFVDFDDYRDADDACHEEDGRDFMGERLTVEIARGTPHGRDRERFGGRRGGSPSRRRGDRSKPAWMDKYGPPTRTDFRLVVENLSSRVSWQDLKDYMRQAGEVTYADAHKNRRNEGNVEFAKYEDLKVAMDKLDGTELNGRRIKLIEPSKRRNKSTSKSRSRSRTRSRSRSRSGDRKKARSKSRSRSRSKSRSRSRSKSKDKEEKKDKRDRSGSRSRENSTERPIDQAD